jgi:hypothetical protein
MQVNLIWHAVPNALYYRVYRGTSPGGPYKQVGQSNPNPAQTTSAANIVTTYQDGPNNLVNGQDYYYVVSAVTQDGESPYSNEFAALWPGAPPVVSSLSGTVV